MGETIESLRLPPALIIDCFIGRCRIRESTWRGSRFVRCRFEDLTIEGSSISGSLFAECEISGLRAENSSLRGSAWVDSTIDDASVTGCDLSKTRWDNVFVTRSRFTRTRLDRLKAEAAWALDTQWNAVTMRKAELSNGMADGLTVTGSKLSRIRLSDADCARSRFDATSLRRSRIDRTVLTSLDAAGIDLRHARVRGLRGRAVRLISPLLAGSLWAGTEVVGVVEDPDVILSSIGLVIGNDGTIRSDD